MFGYRPTAFYNCAFDEFLIRRVFGVRMEETELKVVFDLMDEMGSECEDCERLAERFHCVAMPDGHLDNHIRLHRALTQLMREQAYDFAVIKCWPEMGALHTTPCAVLGRMADEGLLIGCEGDVDAAITQYTEYLLSGEVPFITDLISMDEAEGLLNFWHCGNAAPSLHDTHFEALMSNHPLAGQGTAFYAPLKAGKVTIARFYNVGGQYKLALLSAEAISKERETKGCMVHVHTKRAPRDVIEQLLAEGVPHHYSIVWADIARELCMLSERLGIACVVL